MMSNRRPFHAAACLGLLLGLGGAVATLPALAEGSDAAAPHETVTEELIRLLAEHNALSQEDASKLIKRLQDEKAAAAAPATAATPASEAAPATVAGQAPADKGRVRVIYVPESEKAKIRDEVKQEVIAQAKAENWAQPNAIPDWVRRIHMDGDLRYRQEFDFFDSKNDPNFINFQAVNSGSPVNTNPSAATGGILVFPFLDTTENREVPRVRGRLGLEAAVADDLDAKFRFTTGNNTNPVSTNQTLGTDFNKVTFVIDRAYLDYHPLSGLNVWAGRMPSPWLSTELVWDEDLNFDGVAGQYRYHWGDYLTPRLTLGAFSVENTALDFPSTSAGKVASRDKWLFAAQMGTNWKALPGVDVDAAVAYYYFYHLEGKLGNCLVPGTGPDGTGPDPAPVTSSVSCNTDDSRPGFIQKGNTLFAVRNTVPLVATDPNFQYYGLASPFHVLNATLRLDTIMQGPLHLIYDFDYAYNLAYNKKSVNALIPANNYPPCAAGAATCPDAATGNVAFLLQLRAGYPTIQERWQWNVLGGYRHIDSDAVVDAFNDSDFHLGGTNTKGYYLGGNLGFTHNAWIGGRWYSATEVSGPPLAIDVFQLDLNARF